MSCHIAIWLARAFERTFGLLFFTFIPANGNEQPIALFDCWLSSRFVKKNWLGLSKADNQPQADPYVCV